MLKNNFNHKAVLITGGTKGLGLATGLAFGRVGADIFLTHKWGSADENEVRARFAEVGAKAPTIIEADAANAQDTRSLIDQIGKSHDSLEVFVSNVSFAQVITSLDTYQKRSFLKSLEYSAWPFVGYLQEIKKQFSRLPRYVLGMSCDGPETYYPGYDFVAASKGIMEVFTRYISTEFFEEDVRINILRSRPVSTDSLRATFGEGFEPFLKKYFSDKYFIELEEVGKAALALCSGLMDAVNGQVILLDRGVAFCDNLMRLYEHREDYQL